MRLLTPGNSKHAENKAKATRFVIKHIYKAEKYDEKTGEVFTSDGHTLVVSAYAESTAAFVKTPGVDSSQYSIYASGRRALMVRQMKDDGRLVVYQVDPQKIPPKDGRNDVRWPKVEKASEKMWVYKDSVLEQIKGA